MNNTHMKVWIVRNLDKKILGIFDCELDAYKFAFKVSQENDDYINVDLYSVQKTTKS